MTRIMFYSILACVMLLFISCFEKDELVPPYPGQVVTIEKNIEDFHSYFDFSSDQTVASNATDLWQLGFESDSEGWHIVVNSGANWFIWNSHQQDIDALLNPPSNTWPYDIQSAYPDSTSIGTWTVFENGSREYTNDIYILARYSGGEYIQQKRIRFIHLDSILYRFFYHDEDGGFSDTITITKSDSVHFVYYDFEERLQRNLEPSNTSYDIVFCSYYDLATQFGTTLPYLVRGVFLNLKQTSAVLDSVNTYNQISYDLLSSYTFSSQRDLIGYKWKDVNVNVSAGLAEYTIRDNYNYIIRTMNGRCYKMRFLSFSLNGISGFPRFEFRELKPVQ